MCTQLAIRDEQKIIQTVGELAEMIGSAEILEWSDEDGATAVMQDYKPSWCLCGVAIEPTMEQLGYRVIDGWNQPECVDYVAISPPTQGDA